MKTNRVGKPILIKTVFKALKRHYTRVLIEESGIESVPKGRNVDAQDAMERRVTELFTALGASTEQALGVANILMKLLAPSLILTGHGTRSTAFRSDLRLLT